MILYRHGQNRSKMCKNRLNESKSVCIREGMQVHTVVWQLHFD